MKKASKRTIQEVPGIPLKISEIISYLAHEFSKNNLFEKEDLIQDLYVLYLSTLKKNPKAKDQQPGWFFKLFKWELLTKYRQKIKHINKEWDYIKEQLGFDPNSKYQNYHGEDEEE